MADENQTTPQWQPMSSLPPDVTRILGTHIEAPDAIVYLRRTIERTGVEWADREGVIWCPTHWMQAPEEIRNVES